MNVLLVFGNQYYIGVMLLQHPDVVMQNMGML